MPKLKRIIAIVCLLGLIICPKANAASYGVYMAGNGTFTDPITLTLGVSGSASMGGACGGICGVTGVLNYDRSKIELTAASGMQGFDFTQGTQIVLYKSTAAVDGGILSLRFRNIGLASGESTTVSVSGISITNGDIEVGGGTASKAIQYVAPTPPPAPTPAPTPGPSSPSPQNEQNNSNSGDKEGNKTENESSDENKEENTDDSNDQNKTQTQSQKKSTNASLSTININVGEIEFDKDILSYDIVVSDDTDTIEIDAKAEDDKARVDGVGTLKVKYGRNEYKIIVTAEDGTEKEYVINVYRDGAAEAIARYETSVKILITIIVILFVLIIGAIIWFIIYKKKKQKKTETNIETSFGPEIGDGEGTDMTPPVY